MDITPKNSVPRSPNTPTNYFGFYGIVVQFGVDLGQIKRLYLLKSRETHPDFFTLASANEQEFAMNQASINNEAYKVLSDNNLRTKHILELYEVIDDGQKDELSPNFLMEMMEINEQLVEATFDSSTRQQVENEVESQLKSLDTSEKPLMKAFDETGDLAILPKIKEIYFQRKYLLRIKEKFDTFASP